MPSIKIAGLGGGSRYFTRALADLAVTAGLAGSEIVLYDIDLEKAEIMARHGARLAQESGTGLRVRASTTLAEALDGIDFAICSIGGAGPSMGGVYGTSMHVQDLLIPARYGIYQMVGDTGGPAGMMMALRSIPIYLNICHEMEKRCPDAVLLNHSNPMAVLCRAMIKHSQIQNVIGVCHGVQEGIMDVAGLLGVDPHDLDVVWIGTNHYHWFTRIRHKGVDIYPEVRRRLAEREDRHGRRMTQKLSKAYGYQLVYPPDDHALEFYPFFGRLPDASSAPYGYGEELAERYAALEEMGRVSPPLDEDPSGTASQRQAQLAEFEQRLAHVTLPDAPSDQLTGEGLGNLVEAISIGRRQVQIVNIPNRGSVPNLPDEAILELEAVTDSCGVRGIYTGEAPLSLKGILEKRIAWQELVVEAGVKGDRNLALQALLLDEMAILPEQAEAMLSELLAASKDALPQFI